MAQLLALDLPPLSDIMTDVKRGMTAAFLGITTRSGKTLSAFVNDNLLYPLSILLARRDEFLYANARENASQATPFGATGARADQWAELLNVTIPAAASAQLTIAITGSNNASLPAGAFVAAQGTGKRYTLDAPVAFGAPQTTINANVTAENPGSDYNLAVGDATAIESLPDNIDTIAPVVAILVAGADPANEEQKSQRIQDAFGARGTFRTPSYYISVLRSLDGSIGEVFVDPAGLGAGTVVLYPLLVLTEAEQLTAPWTVNLPTPGAVAGWEVSMQDPDRRGVNDNPLVRVIAVPWIDHTMTIVPNTAEAQGAADAALRARYAQGRGASGYSISNSELVGAVTNASGIQSVTFNDIQPSVVVGHEATIDNVPTPGPTSDVVALHGQLIEPSPTITFL